MTLRLTEVALDIRYYLLTVFVKVDMLPINLLLSLKELVVNG